MIPHRPWSRGVFVAAALWLGTAPPRALSRGAPVPPGAPPATAADTGTVLTGRGAIPFAGSIHVLGGPNADSSWVVLAIGFAPRALTFSADGSEYVARYEVGLELRGPKGEARHLTAREVVRVADAAETRRVDEGVLYQEQLLLPVGWWQVSVSVRDAGRGADGVADTHVQVGTVPRRDTFVAVPVFDAHGRLTESSSPDIVAMPRARAIVGRDSVIALYIEGYGIGEPLVARVSAWQSPAVIGAVGETDRLLTADTVPLIDRGAFSSGVARLALTRMTPGPITIRVEGSVLTHPLVMPMNVGIADQLPTRSLEDALSQLRYFVAPDRLRAVREASPDAKVAAWARLLRETDSLPRSAVHERLRDYATRLVEANERFAEPDVDGWLTARGMVFATLGPPDSTNDVEDPALGRAGTSGVQLWQYTRLGATLRFLEDPRTHRWHLDPVSSQSFDQLALVARALPTQSW